MIAQFKIVPIGKGESLSSYVAECISIVEKSGLRYQLTPMSTIVEGEYVEVMDVIKRCHDRMLELSDRVSIGIEIDDRKGRSDAMTGKVRSVREKLAEKKKK
jgi:uncharacterized protein (TIGR00106 family)